MPRLLRLTLVLVGLVALAVPAHAQSVVTGAAVDAVTGEALPGVNVVAIRLAADSTQTGTATDADGAFRLALPSGAYVLRLSFIGYAPAERTLTVRGEA